MKRWYFFLFVILLTAVIGFFSYKATYGFFSDTETSTGNSITAIIPTPTPTPTPGPGDVVINEIMWMGTQGDAADEWIELRNMTSNTIDFSNWVVDNLGPGLNSVTIPVGKNIPPNGFFLIANDSETTGNHNVAPDVIINVSLNNAGEQLRLRTSAGGTIIDTADNDGGNWFAGEDNPEKSMERNDIPGDGIVSTNWHTATSATNMDPGATESATPKAANSAP